MSRLRPRALAPKVHDALADTPVVAIVGARQTGKSTLVQQAIATQNTPWVYRSLDDLDVLQHAQNDPNALLAGHPGPMAIDEIQRAPELLLAIKASVDRDRRPGRFLITGSADVFALPRVGDALTGRVETITLRPFSQGEMRNHPGTIIDWAFTNKTTPNLPTPSDDLPERMVAGGYPPALERTRLDRRQAWFDAYLNTSLQRDARDIAGITRWTDLPKLMRLLAGRTAHILNLAEASRTSGIPTSTLTRYLQILRNLFLVEEVPAWSTNATKRIARRPKILMSDTGLAAERLGMTAQRWRNQPHHEARGALMETFVGMELIKQASWSRTRVDVNHYREHAGREVDFVLEDRDGQVVGIEVKSAQRVGRDAVANLEHLHDLLGDRFVRGIVLHTGDQTLAMSDRIVALPTHALWTLEA